MQRRLNPVQLLPTINRPDLPGLIAKVTEKEAYRHLSA
jgi:hypothetical protein